MTRLARLPGFNKLKKQYDRLFLSYLRKSWIKRWEREAETYRELRTSSSAKPRLFFGSTPIINNKYWSNALKEVGFEAFSVMNTFYSINKKEDYDLYFEDIFKSSTYKHKRLIYDFVVFDFILKNYDIIHMPFYGLNFSDTFIKENEVRLLKLYGCKIVVLPYGFDIWKYSSVSDVSWKHVLQCNYPQAALFEEKIKKDILLMTHEADIIISGFQTDGIGRWDLFPYNIVSLDTKKCHFNPKRYTSNDGKNGVVKIVHSPNHRYIKGTEYLIDTVNQLKEEGLLIELILLEKRPNDEVLSIIGTEADILVEQLVLGYALSAMEGMASGLPVLSNLSNDTYTRPFRRYSYLNECPILSTTPESIKENLKLLILNPKLREELGLASREFVEKYHSNKTIQFVFGKIYDKIWHAKEVDLMNMFHPLNPDSYNKTQPLVKHPLVENRIPKKLLDELKQS